MMFSPIVAWLCLFGGTAAAYRLLRRWLPAPVPRLLTAVGLAAMGLYVLGGLLFLLHAGTVVYTVAAALWVIGGLAYGGRALWTAPALIRGLLAVWLAYTIWILLLTAISPTYSGGDWTSDWFEHYQRTQFYLEHWDARTIFLQIYLLTARPPLQNVITHFILGAGGGVDFIGFQGAMAALNALMVLPFVGAAGLLPKRYRRAAFWTLTLMAFATPFIVWNGVYPWTRGLTNFLIGSALLLYLHVMRRPRFRYAAAAFWLLAAGAIAHFSAGPYIVILLLHYLSTFRPARLLPWLRETVIIGVVSVAILATWFVPAIAAYGVEDTLKANSSVERVEAMGTETAMRIKLHNLSVTLVPHFLRGPDPNMQRHHPDAPAWMNLSNHSFLFTQTNLVGMLGAWLLLALAIAWLAWRARRDPDLAARLSTAPARPATLALSSIGILILGIFVVGEGHRTGCAHLCLQSLLMAWLAGLALAIARAPKRWRLLPWILAPIAALPLVLNIHTVLTIRAMGQAGQLTKAMVFDTLAIANYVANVTYQLQADLTAITDKPMTLLPTLVLGLVLIGLLARSRSPKPVPTPTAS